MIKKYAYPLERDKQLINNKAFKRIVSDQQCQKIEYIVR
jgi:hypothetical protein